MAEALGLASSIITVIELSAKAVKQCKHIIDTARDAPRDLRNILVEVSSLKAALENLDYLNKIDHDFAEEVSNQKGIGNAVHKCEETLGDLVKQLGDLSIRDSRQTRPGKRAKLKAAIQWTWNETTARKLINDVLQHKTTITLGLLTQTS
jgi:nicotinate-nucleotide pyrophosphorylase